MGRKKSPTVNDRARHLLAQEAARIIVDQGIHDYRVAKIKASERLNLTDRGSLPSNSEIEAAVRDHLELFGRETHVDLLRGLRQAALSAMDLLAQFAPRLVGPVLRGTAISNSAVNLHIFSDSAELVALTLDEQRVSYQLFERRLKSRRNQTATFAAYRFTHDNAPVEATVFPIDGVRQAPISPIDGKPMQRADQREVQRLLDKL